MFAVFRPFAVRGHRCCVRFYTLLSFPRRSFLHRVYVVHFIFDFFVFFVRRMTITNIFTFLSVFVSRTFTVQTTDLKRSYIIIEFSYFRSILYTT